MKKLMKYGAFAALATLALVQSGCMNVDDEITPSNGYNLVVINALAEEHRSELGNDGKSVTWSNGDQIGVFYYTKNSAGKNTKHADNKPYTATIKEQRNPKFHKKYFALINCAWAFLTERQTAFFKENVGNIVRVHFAKKDETLYEALNRLENLKKIMG